MNLNDINRATRDRSAVIVGLVLAVLATGVSIAMAVFVGWQRGGGILAALISALAVLGAHLLPALLRSFRAHLRPAVTLIWLVCLVMVVYGHAGAFLIQLQQGGMHRADLVQFPVDIEKPQRNMPTVLSEKAKVQAELMRVKATLTGLPQEACGERCTGLRGRLAGLTGRLEALEAEAELIRRWVSAHDETAERQKAAYADPVALTVEGWFGVTEEKTNLAAAVGYSVILEGLACLGWLLVLTRRDVSGVEPASQLVMASVTQEEMRLHSQQDVPKVTPNESLSVEIDNLATQLVPDVQAGRLRPTVDAVMRHLSCSRTKAGSVARQLKARLADNSQLA